jgi:hypothetical protein
MSFARRRRLAMRGRKLLEGRSDSCAGFGTPLLEVCDRMADEFLDDCDRRIQVFAA